MKRKVFFALVLFCAASVSLCACGKADKKSEGEKIELNKKSDVMLVGESTVLLAELVSGEKDAKLIWDSSNSEIAEVSEDGEITAGKSGETEITVRTQDGKLQKKCRIMVADRLVAPKLDEKSDNFGILRFAKVQDAVDAAKSGDTVYVIGAKYDEDVKCGKSISIKGLGKPQIKSFKATSDGLDIKIEDVVFYAQDYPPETEATLAVGAESSLELKGCAFVIDIKEQPPKSQTGGYAIYTGRRSKALVITENSFKNYNYGVYMDKNGARIDVRDNMFSECRYGLGLDIRNPDSPVPENFTPHGTVSGNVFIEVQVYTQFYYIGDNYQGDFTFKDHRNSSEQMEKRQQAAESK